MYYLYINQIKADCNSLGISHEKKEQQIWEKSEIQAGHILQIGSWGPSKALIIKAQSRYEAESIIQKDPLNEYGFLDQQLIAYHNQLPYLEPYMQEAVTFGGGELNAENLLEENLECKLVCLDEARSIKVDSFKNKVKENQAPQKARAENMVLVLDGMIEAMVEYKLEDVQKFQVYKTRKDLSASQMNREAKNKIRSYKNLDLSGGFK